MIQKCKDLAVKSYGSVVTLSQKIAAAQVAPSERQARTALFVFGLTVLMIGLSSDALARTTNYNDERITNALDTIMTYLEGSFGALIMAACGIGAIMSAAFGQYKAALSLMVVAVGAFIIRSLMTTFFNVDNVQWSD